MSSSVPTYRQAIDLARFVAAFGIVATHAFARRGDWVGHLSLGLFMVLAAYLAVQSLQRASGSYPYVARAKRLLLPWLFWCLFFRIILFKITDGPDRYAVLSDPWSLLVGPMVHLWFLPFVIVAMSIVRPLSHWITTPQRLAVSFGALLILTLPAFGIVAHLELPVPLPQWLTWAPIYGLGVLTGIAHQLRRGHWPLVFAAIMSAEGWVLLDGETWTFMIFGAIAVFELFWRLKLDGDWARPLGQVTFGIYLIHPFFMLAVYKLAGNDVNRYFMTVVVFMMSWITIAGMRRWAFFRRVT